jgi:hypothetical protein
MNAKELLIRALREIGADGLYNWGMECGCGIDDLEPCDSCELLACESAKLHEDGMYYPMEDV